MIKVLGKFKSLEGHQILTIELNKKNFDSLKDHIAKNMFFSYIKAVHMGVKKILLSSIGDHLNKNDEQDFEKAEVSIEVTVKEELTLDQIDQLESWHTWVVMATCGKESIGFAIDKETEFIKTRKYDAG